MAWELRASSDGLLPFLSEELIFWTTVSPISLVRSENVKVFKFFFSVLNPGYSRMLNLRQSRTICYQCFDSFLGQYSPEKFHPPHEKKAPCFTFKTRTKYSFKDPTPSPNSYSLPPLIGPKGVNKASAPAYSLSGRSTIGGFSEDLQKVRVNVLIIQLCFVSNSAS